MMSRLYYRDGSLSDNVFSEEESGFQDFYSPAALGQVFSPNISMTSLRDIYSPRVSNRDVSSPAISNYSTYSQEVKYLFDPKYGSESVNNLKMATPSQFDYDPAGNSVDEDYSQIQYNNKKANLQRKHSNSSQYSYKGHGQGHGQGHQGQNSGQGQVYLKPNSQNLVPPPPPPRTSSSASTSQLSQHGEGNSTARQQQGEGNLTARQRYMLSHSMSASYSSAHYYPQHQPSRRKTWSPEGLQHGVSSGNIRRDHRLRSYSNEQLIESVADNRDHIYEELEAGPPKLAPISGILNRSPGRGIIKPIAFKPVLANQKQVNQGKAYHADHPRKYSSHDDGYGSQDYGVTSQNAANVSHGSGSSHMDCDRSASFSSDTNKAGSERSDSVLAAHMSRLSSAQHLDGYVQTPSPSDSGVGELEAILKEKDAEIHTLRDVMDKNERAILQVYEEKRNCWLRDLTELREEYENKMKTQQRKSYKSEQVLNLQIYKLQQEKKTMKEQVDKLSSEREELGQKCEAYAEDTNRLQAQMDDATWQGRRASGSVLDLQHTIDELQHKLSNKSDEVFKLQTKLEDVKFRLDETNANTETRNRLKHETSSTTSLQRLNTSNSDLEPDIPLCQCEKEIQTDFVKTLSPERETLKPSLICERDRELSVVKEELDKLRLEILVNKEEHDKDKEQWLEEKNKVIMYQKQLQLNYVQMFRKNKVLEAEVEQLTLELESRDMKLMALNGEESVC